MTMHRFFRRGSVNKPAISVGALIAIVVALWAALNKPNNATSTTLEDPKPSGRGSGQPAAASSAPPASKTSSTGPASMPFGSRDVPAKAKGTIRLATYNVENLYDDKDDPTNSWAEELDSTKPAEHRKAAADAIRAIDADVLALEEVESKAALDWFLKSEGLDALYPHVVSIDAGDGRGIEQSVVSKFPLSNPTNWINAPLTGTHPASLPSGQSNRDAGKPLVMHRSPLSVDVTIPSATTGGKDYAVTMLVVHCKSGRDFGYIREAEAAKHIELASAAEKAKPGRNIVILGDFNARKVEPSVQTYLSAGFADPFADLRPADAKFQTHVTNRVIDHILLNANMKREFTGVRFVYAMPLSDAGFSAPKPAGYASDHLPVFIDLKPVD